MIAKISNHDLPETWEELVSIKKEIKRFDSKIVRFTDDINFYHTYNKLVPKQTRMEIIFNLIGDNDYKIIRNNFPYLRLIKNIPFISHYCLWSRVGKLPQKTIESEITKKFPNKEYFWFENIKMIKSVPEIWHCHIFVKEK